MASATALPVAPVATDVTSATLDCIARFGLTKLTVEDVARASGRSRATLYRAFPSRRELVAAAVNAELDRLIARLVEVGRVAPTLADAVTDVVATGARELRASGAFAFVATHEREVLHPYLSFAGGDRFYAAAATRLAPAFAPWCVDPARTAEWVVRVGVTLLWSTHPAVDATDRAAVHEYVTTFIVPGLTDPTPTPKELA
jgi:AcrR family transcriptional regulator